MQWNAKQTQAEPCSLGCTSPQFPSAWGCCDCPRLMVLGTGCQTTDVRASESRGTPGEVAWLKWEGEKCPVNPDFALYPHFLCGMSRKTTYVCQEGISTEAQNKMTPQLSISTRCLSEENHRLSIRRNFLRLWCIKLRDHLPRGAVGAMKPATYSTVKRPVGASPILVQGSRTESSTMPFPTLAPKNQTQEVQRKKDKQWCQFAKEIQPFFKILLYVIKPLCSHCMLHLDIPMPSTKISSLTLTVYIVTINAGKKILYSWVQFILYILMAIAKLHC